MAMRANIALVALALAIPAAAQVQPDWNNAATAEVTLRSFSFTPGMLMLRAGVPVKLTIRDEKGGHSFSAPAFFAAARIAPEDREKVVDGKVELTGGEAATIRLVPAAGTYKLTCTHFLHTSFGMKGTIIVQ